MKVFLDSIGCRLNQSEIERLGAQFRATGHQLVADASMADLVIVNTCAVTAAASADSRKKIRSAAKAGRARIIATGCYASIDPQTVSELPSIEQIFSNEEKDHLVYEVLGRDYDIPFEIFPRAPLPGEHKRTRAFIKIQDGCDNFCTFCITRIARGQSRSTPKREVFKDIEQALSGGVKEIVLTGVNLGSWGRDISNSGSLGSLIDQIIDEFQPPRLRLSSLEPWDLDEQILDQLRKPCVCPHLHLPLQSGSDVILQKMARKINTSDYSTAINKIRNTIPDIAITTDIMVGFPEETDEEFNKSLNYITQMHFAGGHVFSYSVRPGTPAEKYQEKVNHSIIKKRSQRMRKEFEETAHRYQEQFLGKNLEVLWEKSKYNGQNWDLTGLSGNYLKVRAESNLDLYNQISTIEIQAIQNTLLTGKIIPF